MIYNGAQEVIDYRIIDINRKYEEILGLKKEDIVGKPASEVYGTADSPYLEAFSEVAQTGEPIRFETYFPPMNKHFSISVLSLGKDRFVTVFDDITERKRAEEALRESEQLLSNVFESMQEGVLVLGPDSKYTHWNRKMEEISHISRKDVLGRIPWEKFPFIKGDIEEVMKKSDDRCGFS